MGTLTTLQEEALDSTGSLPWENLGVFPDGSLRVLVATFREAHTWMLST